MIKFAISNGLNVRSTTNPQIYSQGDIVFSRRQDREPKRSRFN